MAQLLHEIPAWIENEFIRTHLLYVDKTESPTIMQVWAAVAAAAAAMGRHAWLETGFGKLYANQFILLVGPPGTRKSTAINNAIKPMKQSTGVKFAPNDTGGQRQGLIAAIEEADDDELEDAMASLDVAADMDKLMLNLANVETSINLADRHSLFVCASEFGSFLGQSSLELTRFLIEMWDAPESYTYKIKKFRNELKNPLLNLIGGTTSTDLSSLLPPEAVGQGFMSRIILVYAPEKRSSIPPSKAGLNKTLHKKLANIYSFLYHDLRGSMELSDEANDYSDTLYDTKLQIMDARFIYYAQRRHTHLLKLATVLAATNKSTVVSKQDIQQANIILVETEKRMTEALGEFGLSPLAHAKQKMVEFIRHANGPVRDDILWLHLRKDMKLLDFRNAVAELVNANKVSRIDTRQGKALIFNDSVNDLLDVLAETEDDVL